MWDQFRGPDGSLLYPQRPLLSNSADVGPGYATQSGKFNCKMIVIECLMDEAAYPWQADWYRARVRAALGPNLDNQYRLWFVDNAMHVNPSSYMTPSEGGPTDAGHSWVDTHIISYTGILQQALRDVAAWAERGIAPPESTSYEMDDGQVVIPVTAAARKSIQPVVTLTVNGGERADVRAGETLDFEAKAEAPPQTGSIVFAEWDFDGGGAYLEPSSVSPAPQVTVSTTHTFTKPGTYFPAVRVGSNREGDNKTLRIGAEPRSRPRGGHGLTDR